MSKSPTADDLNPANLTDESLSAMSRDQLHGLEDRVATAMNHRQGLEYGAGVFGGCGALLATASLGPACLLVGLLGAGLSLFAAKSSQHDYMESLDVAYDRLSNARDPDGDVLLPLAKNVFSSPDPAWWVKAEDARYSGAKLEKEFRDLGQELRDLREARKPGEYPTLVGSQQFKAAVNTTEPGAVANPAPAFQLQKTDAGWNVTDSSGTTQTVQSLHNVTYGPPNNPLIKVKQLENGDYNITVRQPDGLESETVRGLSKLTLVQSDTGKLSITVNADQLLNHDPGVNTAQNNNNIPQKKLSAPTSGMA